ncbi:MAG: HAMP domain-containing sensor histidine kinase [Oscillospiraceae bacterium]|nr:HAMP domain-containing sensor histidine kinase [Oscillospiraceae bacterium]
MFKRLSTQITVSIFLILTIVMGTVSAVYILNSKEIYVSKEIKAIDEFYSRLKNIDPVTESEKIDTLLDEYEMRAYKINIYNRSLNSVYTTTRARFKPEINTEAYTESGNAKFIKNKNGVELISLKTSADINGEKYYIQIDESLKTVDAVFKHTNRYLLYGIVLFMLVSLTSIYIIINKAMKPVGELNDAAHNMASGDYSSRFNGKIVKNEIGNLSVNFNNMADTIQENVNKITNYNFLLKEDMKRMTEYDKMRKRVLSNVTHELKTPLAIISSQIEMMACVDDAEKRDYYYNSALKEIETMSALISRLLNFSSGEKDVFEAEVERVDVSARIRSNISKMKPLFQSKNIRCRTDIQGGCYLNIIPNHIDRIFNNYVINAIHHVSPDGLIEISLKSVEEGIRLSVYNDGAGINEDEISKVWTDFYKKENDEYEMNAGLGLFIVKEISVIDSDLCGVENKKSGVEFWYMFRTNNEKELLNE